MSPPSWLDEQMRKRITAIFRECGVDTNIWLAKEIDPTEVVFVVETDGDLPEALLAKQLTDALHRKVWVTVMSDAWRSHVELISATM